MKIQLRLLDVRRIGVVAAALLVCGVAWAQQKNFDVPATEAVKAIPEFARQAGIQIVAPADELKDVRTAALHGELDTRTALRQLLVGTGLEVASDDGGVITLRRIATPVSSSANGIVEQHVRLTQANQTENTQNVGSSENQNNPNQQHTEEQDDPSALKQKDQKVQEIVVTGTNIRGATDVASHAMTFSREEIERSGFTTTEDFFSSLPQNFAAISSGSIYGGEADSPLVTANFDSASGIDLRGLGSESTLVLLNGKRLAGNVGGRVIDISAIPLSVIDSTEVVLGGRSAIYGSDAVGGVVNLVTRRRFSGAETQLSYGAAKDGGERTQFSQIFGKESENGGFVFVYDHLKNNSLDLKDTGLMPDVTSNGATPIRLDYLPDIERHSGFLSGDWTISDKGSIYFDGLYTRKESDTLLLARQPGGTQDSFNDVYSESDQYSASLGVDFVISEAWKLDVSSVFSRVDSNFHKEDFLDYGFFSAASETDNADESSVATYSAVVDGPIGGLGNRSAKVAFGVEYRSEDFKRERGGVVADDKDRSVSSAFVEFLVPLLAADGRSRLDLSLAGRYDDYSDFGNTFNPQIGLVWEPTRSFALRGSYATAFRAPAMIELGSETSALILDIPDPLAAAGFSPLIIWAGKQRQLTSEDATTWSVGLDIEPESLPGLRLSVSYWDVDYERRIGEPAPTVPDWFAALANEGSFVGLVNRSPTPADIDAVLAGDSTGLIVNASSSPWNPATEDILAAIPNLVILDNRTTNIGVEAVRGVDLTVRSSFDTKHGAWNYGLNTSFTIDYDRQVTATSIPFERLNDVGQPVDLRVRVDGGWSRDAYSASVFVNYVDGYSNSLAFPVGRIDSWTTLDLSVRFDGSAVAESGFLSGFSTAVSVRNALDNDPPAFADGFSSQGFDPANSNPFGRQFAITFSKHW